MFQFFAEIQSSGITFGGASAFAYPNSRFFSQVPRVPRGPLFQVAKGPKLLATASAAAIKKLSGISLAWQQTAPKDMPGKM